MQRKRKTYKYNRIMELVLHDNSVFGWVKLYEKLGVVDFMRSRGVIPDVKYVYMSPKLQQYISAIFVDKYVTGRYDARTPKYASNASHFDSLCYSPKDADVGDVLLVDLTEEASKKLCREYKNYMPDFDKRY